MANMLPPPTYADPVVVNEVTKKASFNPVWLNWFLQFSQLLAESLVTTTNIGGGAAGEIPYQTAPSTTGFTAAGTTGQALVSGGTGSPTWTTGKLTLAGDLETIGAHFLKVTTTADSSITAPTSGTLATLAGAESLTNKKLGSLTNNGLVQTSAGDGTLSVVTGAWTTPTYSGSNFTASGSQTWTVESGDVITYAYIQFGKTMIVSWELQTTSVGGTPDRYLYIAIPNGGVSAKAVVSICEWNQGSWSAGRASTTAGGSVIRIEKFDSANWAASTNASYFDGQIVIELQ